ncbi:hypothetical protein JOC85_004333 [Bacillus mesophilus]|uniref:Citrate transporter-like domain-containing protein n=1 Tax=Bacillus mesophilus TaxID=1808955 RepID=A0A6M0QCV2_9BACI|nr:hypothetical protein [Bacillus mesophilus]MBM7663457.1 hypothetical protein [Bacillus mesophilus]NEY74192.1 hypothetical protein [Bacillus mesophilus]
MIQLIMQRMYVIYTFILIVFTINIFWGNSFIETIVGLMAIPMLVLSFYGASKLFRILGSIFIGVGVILFVSSGLPLNSIPVFMTVNMPLLAFLLVLPWMNSVVRAGRYDRRLKELMEDNVSNLGKLYVRTSFTTYILCTFINISALSLSQEILISNLSKLKKKLRDSFISRITLRAFALALAWSPMEIMVAMAIDATGVSYIRYLPWLLLISFFVLIIEWLRGRRRFKEFPYNPIESRISKKMQPRIMAIYILKLLTALVVFLSLVVTIGNLFHLNFILTVTLVILPFSFGWALLMKRGRSFLKIGWKTWKVRSNSIQNFVVLFLSLSFFTSTLNETPFLQLIQQPFIAVGESPLLILFLIQFTYLAMCLIGVHPVATIGILSEVIQPLYAFVNPLSIGIVLIVGALATATVGAYGVTVTLTSMNTKQNPYHITLRNMPFALFYGTVGTLVAYLLL